MRTVFLCVTADDIHLEGYATPEHLEKLLRFWDDQGLKGTLFVVPRSNGKPLCESKAYVEILARALEGGHEVALHGLDHGRFETGIPPAMVLDLSHEGPARKYLAENRDKIQASLTVENLRKTLATGRDIIESALPVRIQGFRAAALSTCDNLFVALEKEGFLYDSSRVLQTAAWDLINRPEEPITPRPVNRSRFDAFQVSGRMRILPLLADYTWYLTREHYDAFLELAKHDFDACLAGGLPFVSLCHISPIEEGDPECGYDLYRQVLAHARSEADKHGVSLACCTMSDVLQRDTMLFS